MATGNNPRGPILTTKLRNEILKRNRNDKLAFAIKNVSVNGTKRGCSGFVINTRNNACVWLSTDNECCPQRFVYRYAKDTRDFHGGTNRWRNTLSEFASDICKMLENPDVEWKTKFAPN